MAQTPEESFTVTPEVLRQTLEERPTEHNEVLLEPKTGVVTGLAWTQAGGEILYIETLFNPGRGELIITGQLGDVAQEVKEKLEIAPVSTVTDLLAETGILDQREAMTA